MSIIYKTEDVCGQEVLTSDANGAQGDVFAREVQPATESVDDGLVDDSGLPARRLRRLSTNRARNGPKFQGLSLVG